MDMNFPKNDTELKARLALIKEGIPNQGNNKRFAIPAFQLFMDCGLNTPENISFLCDKRRCDDYFGCTMNPLGGVLRRQDQSMIDEGGISRYYYFGKNNLYVTLNGIRYYISNYWQFGCKEAFFSKWLREKATQACKKYGTQNDSETFVNPSAITPPTKTPTTEELIQILIIKNEHLDKVNTALCDLVVKLHREIETLENKVDKLTLEVSEIKNMWK